MGNRSWVFQGVKSGEETVSLFYVNDTPIKRHTKIQSEVNPYDPQFEQYFEKRLEQFWKGSTVIRRKLYGLWVEQDKRCLLCHQLISQDTDWDVHHLVRRVDGGSDNFSNLVLLHPTCHTQFHAAGLTVRKPARS